MLWCPIYFEQWRGEAEIIYFGGVVGISENTKEMISAEWLDSGNSGGCCVSGSIGSELGRSSLVRIRTFILALFFPFLCGIALCSLDDSLRAEEFCQENEVVQRCIDKWKRNLDALRVVKFSASFIDWAEFEDGTRTDDNPLRMDWIIDFTNGRYWKGVVKQDGIADKEKYRDESAVVDGKILLVSKYLFDNQVEFGVLSNINVDHNLWESSLRLLYWGFPFGYIESGDTRFFLPEILCAAELKITDTNGCPVLHGSTSDFTVTIEFNSEECQFVKSLVIRRIAKADNPFVFQECRYIVSRADVFNGVFLPVDYHVEEKQNGGKKNTVVISRGDSVVADEVANIPSRTLKADVKLANVVLPKKLSNDDFKISMGIPDYTSVSMIDSPHIDHIWHDGKIVPKTDEIMLAIARGGHKFMPGPKESRFWLMSAGIGLILFSCGVKIYRYFKNRKDK